MANRLLSVLAGQYIVCERRRIGVVIGDDHYSTKFFRLVLKYSTIGRTMNSGVC